MNTSDRIYVAGHRGLIGSALCKSLLERGYNNLITADRAQLDLLDEGATRRFLSAHRPDIVIIAAAKVGGIIANSTYKADFIHENLAIQNNLIWAAHESNVRRLIFLGSSCIYPKNASQPMPESSLLTGTMEYSNRPYALAKIAGLEMVHALRKQFGRDYFSVMPTNLFGPHDNFHPQNSHVVAGMILKFHEAVEADSPFIQLWGTGTPRREFMFSYECADAIVHLAETITPEYFDSAAYPYKEFSHINIGVGYDISIAELARMISEIMGYKGEIRFDSTFPDGVTQKLLDVSVLRSLGWTSKIDMKVALKTAIDWFKSQPNVRKK